MAKKRGSNSLYSMVAAAQLVAAVLLHTRHCFLSHQRV
ncbi:Uncharacterised protein [Vibrio cholerae]|nr:Uncharacterised protein [Vibrio cholerae]